MDAKIVSFSQKKNARIHELTPGYLLSHYWKSKEPVKLLDLIPKIREFSLAYEEINIREYPEMKGFFAEITWVSDYHFKLYHCPITSESHFNLLLSFALSYIIQDKVNSLHRSYYIDKRVINFSELSRSVEDSVAVTFSKALLMPLDTIIQAIEELNSKGEEASVGNIANRLYIGSLLIVLERLSELGFLKGS